MRTFRSWTVCWLAILALLVQGATVAQEREAFSEDRLDQLVAPIALYPDSVVAQILMASTYPLEIVQAARWREKNPKLKDQDLEKALVSQTWDPSVKALTNFPNVLARMSENLDWTQDLGDAALSQQPEVLAAVQRMRRRAHDAGNLKTSAEQKVIVKEQIIQVEPASEVVYIPAYSPTVVYGTAWAPPTYYYPIYSYPPSYWYPPGYAASNIISFGLGMAVGAAVWNNWNWGHCDWRGGSVNIDRNFNYNRNVNTGNINIGNQVGGGRYGKWEHNVEHRGGVRYRDDSTRARYDKQRAETKPARVDRDTARGVDRQGDRPKERAGERQGERTGDRGAERSKDRSAERPKERSGERQGERTASRGAEQRTDRGGDRGSSTRDLDRPRPSAETRDLGGGTRPRPSHDGGGRSGSRSSAFDVGDSGFTRSASNRGATSRGSYGGGGGGGGRAAASGARAGGGHAGGGARGGGGGRGGGRGR